MTENLGTAAHEAGPPEIGTAWGCPVCKADGPLMSSPCPYCQAEVTPVILTARKEAVRLFNQGLEAARSGFWSDAVELVWQALDLAGPDSGVLSLYGLLLHQVGRTPEAVAAWRQAGAVGAQPGWLEEAESASEPDIAALEAYNAALLSAGWGQWEHALKRLEPATMPDSRLAVAFVVKGLAAWALNRRGMARASWERALELDPSAPGLQACMVAMLDEVMAEARSTVRPEPGLHTPVSPTAASHLEAVPDMIRGVGDEERTALRTDSPAAPTRARAWWVPAVVALLVVASTGGAGYVISSIRSESAVAEAIAGKQAAESARAAAEGQAARSDEASRTAQAAAAVAEGARTQAERILAQTQAAMAQAEEAARQAAAREGVALQLLAAANPSGTASDLERLLTAVEEARRLRLALPDWVERTLAAVRTRAAVERYFEGYQAFLADDFTTATAAFAASLRLDSAVYTGDDAAYLAARSEDLAGRAQEAAAWYGRVIEEFRESAYVDDALYFGARAAERAGERPRAIRWYQELLTRFPGSGYDWEAESALRRLGQ